MAIPTWTDERGQAQIQYDSGRSYPALDGLRGLAAIVVVYYHVTSLATRYEAPWIGHGHLAVDLFFALSGFVLHHAYRDRLGRGMSTGRFLILRLVRLYPLYAVGLAIGIAANLLILTIDPAQAMTPRRLLVHIATGLAIFPSLPPGDVLFPLNGPAWTLMCELIVNMLMVALWRWISFRRVALLCVVLAIGLTAQVVRHGDAAMGDSWAGLIVGILRCAVSFSLGILIYMAARRPRVAGAPQALRFAFLSLSLASALVFPPPQNLSALYDLAFIFAISPLCILLGSQIVLTHRIVRLCTLLGVTSYALYVTHCPMIRVVLLWCDTTGVFDYCAHLFIFASAYTLIFTLVAYALDRFYDFPVRRWLGRRAATLAPHPAPGRAPAG